MMKGIMEKRLVVRLNSGKVSACCLLMAWLCGVLILPTRAADTSNSGGIPAGVPAQKGQLTANPSGYVADDIYKLRVGDTISFQILEDRDQPRSLMVTDSGELNLPYVGRVPVVDKTCKELAAQLKSLLEKEYYYRATVIVSLDVANKVLGRVYIWGQVKSQGPVDLGVGENLTAGKAILKAGGFADFANKSKVKLVRGGSESASKKIMELNMTEILEGGQTEKDVILKPDDSIIVSSRLINF